MARHFKATAADGSITVFRSSETRVYRSATIDRSGWFRFHLTDGPGQLRVPVQEIGEEEMQMLRAEAMERFLGANRARRGSDITPSDSYVRHHAGAAVAASE